MQTEITAKLVALLDAAHEKDTFDGVALVSRGDTILCKKAWGFADRERKIKHDVHRPFPLCSITKQFTALLVMQEVARKTLRLEGAVADILPDFGAGDARRKQITVQHLLSHLSGLPNTDAVPDFYQNPDKRIADDPAFVVRTYLSGDLLSEPGAAFSYNNGDTMVLAALLQKVTGKPFADLLSERITKPLHLTRTSLVSEKAPRQVTGYAKTEKGWEAGTPVRLQNFGAAGAMQSTVEDMHHWNRALFTDRLLPRPIRDVMWTSDKKHGYVACGSWVYAYLPFGGKTPTLVERQGEIYGIFTQNLLVPDEAVAITLLTNGGDAATLSAYSGQGITCDLLRVVLG